MPHGPKTRRIPKEAIARRLKEDSRKKKTSPKPDGGESGKRGQGWFKGTGTFKNTPRKRGEKIHEDDPRWFQGINRPKMKEPQ